MNDRSIKEAVRMLREMDGRLRDIEESDRGDEAPRLLRSISDNSLDDDAVTLDTHDAQRVAEASSDSENVTMTTSANNDGQWNNTDWSSSTWE